MQFRTFSLALALLATTVSSIAVIAQEPPTPSTTGQAIPESLGVHDLFRAAGDLRMASEALERFGQIFADIGVEVAESLSRISSEFDPFGYKTGFRTIAEQSEIIQQQQRTIFWLQQREIERLRLENQQLKERTAGKRTPQPLGMVGF